MTNLTTTTQDVSIFSDPTAFEQAQRMVAPLAKSTMIPAAYFGNVPNCMVALEMSYRLNRSVLMVMQNTDIINGKPSLGSAFVISLINASGLFSEPLEFVFDNEENPTSCYATTKRKNGKVLRGTTITIAMAKAEGWWDKKGSKWQTMAPQMLQYRAAAFFGRVHCPDVLMGMQTMDEVVDVGVIESRNENSSIAKFNETVAGPEAKVDVAEVTEFEEIKDENELTVTGPEAEMEVTHEAVTQEADPNFTPAAETPSEEDDDF